jgi:hypothetical protein
MSVAIRPDFLKVLRGDVDRVGLEGAHLLALIRYVTDLPGERNGRRKIDGHMCWLASYAAIADALGGTNSQKVGRLIRALQGKCELIGTAPDASDMDQTKAYRVPRDPQCSPVKDEGHSDNSDLNIAGHECSDLNGTGSPVNGYRFKSEHSSSIGELGELGERAASADERSDERRNGSPHATALNGIPIEPPKRACKRYPHSEPCGTCASDNRAYEAWVAASWPLLSELARVADNTKDQEQARAIHAERQRRLIILRDLGESRK